MAQENFSSTNQWIYNCGKRDFDYRVYWGNNGTITIRRHNLIEIEYTMKAWNSKDGWTEETKKQTLPEPTEEHTFYAVGCLDAFGLNDVSSYWGRRYIISGTLKIRFCDPPGEIEEIYTTTVNECFRRYDPHYYDYYGCTPQDIQCEVV